MVGLGGGDGSCLQVAKEPDCAQHLPSPVWRRLGVRPEGVGMSWVPSDVPPN